jgi:hypothetical protein
MCLQNALSGWDGVSKWSRLRSVGNSLPARLTILIPLVGYLIIFNQVTAKYLTLIQELAGRTSPDHPISVSPRLLLVYFGLCALALGSAIYSYFCPNQVRHYGSSAAYVRGDGPSIRDFAFEPIESELRESAFRKEYLRIRNRYEGGPNGPPRMITPEQKEEVNNGVLHLYFRYLDASHRSCGVLRSSPMRSDSFVCSFRRPVYSSESLAFYGKS